MVEIEILKKETLFSGGYGGSQISTVRVYHLTSGGNGGYNTGYNTGYNGGSYGYNSYGTGNGYSSYGGGHGYNNGGHSTGKYILLKSKWIS